LTFPAGLIHYAHYHETWQEELPSLTS